MLILNFQLINSNLFLHNTIYNIMNLHGAVVKKNPQSRDPFDKSLKN